MNLENNAYEHDRSILQRIKAYALHCPTGIGWLNITLHLPNTLPECR